MSPYQNVKRPHDFGRTTLKERDMSKFAERSAFGASIFVILLMLAVIWGWVANIIKLVGMDMTSITGMLVVRVAGIFVPPLGSVVGFL